MEIEKDSLKQKTERTPAENRAFTLASGCGEGICAAKLYFAQVLSA